MRYIIPLLISACTPIAAPQIATLTVVNATPQPAFVILQDYVWSVDPNSSDAFTLQAPQTIVIYHDFTTDTHTIVRDDTISIH